MYFTIPAKANYSDCDANNRLKLSAAMKLMQQTSSEQLEHMGFSPAHLMEKDMVFLLSKMCIRVHRMPVCTEELHVGTAAVNPRGARFVREFVIDSTAGERLLSAFSLWILVDPASRRIYRPKSFPYPLTFQPAQLEDIIDDVPIPKEQSPIVETTHRTVQYSHIDVYHHVNNTVYADFICDALPYAQLCESGIDMLTISFQNEAKWGDMVHINTHRLEQQYHLVGLHGDNRCFEAVVQFKTN